MKCVVLSCLILVASGFFVGCADSANDSSADTKPVAKDVPTKPATDDSGPGGETVNYNELSDYEKHVILEKGTELPGTGELLDNKQTGTYICRQCNAALYKSEHKFESHCGWPSFDDEIEGAVLRRTEDDGTGRTEIVCNNCKGHLGHVFLGEGMTAKNTRHCVNSVSMAFVKEGEELPETIVIEK